MRLPVTDHLVDPHEEGDDADDHDGEKGPDGAHQEPHFFSVGRGERRNSLNNEHTFIIYNFLQFVKYY